MSDTPDPAAPLVLVLEEETHERDAIADHLREAGFAVCPAADSDEAMVCLEEHPDLRALVTDAHVPGRIDGHALAAAIRRQRPSVAVVLMSGHSDESSGPVPEGAAFVSKPFLFERLVPALRRLLAQS
jgi:DNA-binding NtrC family response regulator